MYNSLMSSIPAYVAPTGASSQTRLILNPSWKPFCSNRRPKSIQNCSSVYKSRCHLSMHDDSSTSTSILSSETTESPGSDLESQNVSGFEAFKKQLLSRSSTQPLRFYEFDPENIISVRLRHVQVETEELADYILAAIKSSEKTLQELAAQLSTCKESKDKGGDMGWIHRKDRFTLIKDNGLADFIFDIRPRMVQKYKAANGQYHVLVVEDALHALKYNTVERGQFRNRKIPKKDQAHYTPNTYHVVTMGCQANKADSERMAGEMERIGLQYIENEFEAQVVCFNTCSIREHSEQKVYDYLGRHALRKRQLPNIQIVVSGCVAQQEGERLLRHVPEVDIVMGPQYANRLGSLLEFNADGGQQLCATEPIHIMEDISQPKRESKTTAWINIIYGCNERCTYCVVPSTRGLEQSRDKTAIREEMEQVAKQGIREVVLLGQNIDAYGRDLYPKETFADLLRFVHDVPGIERIRFATSHPRYMSDNLINALAELPKLCGYIHLPFQAGSDKVLLEMKRGYTRSRYLQIIENIRRVLPDAAITADAIVGFPGETEEEFQETLDLMDEVVFDLVNTAAYSPRPNTPAAEWPNQISEQVKQDRLARINLKVKQHAEIQSRKYLGKIEQIYVEQVNHKDPNQVSGRTRGNRLVHFEGDINKLQGKFVDVRVVATFPFYLKGEMIPGSEW